MDVGGLEQMVQPIVEGAAYLLENKMEDIMDTVVYEGGPTIATATSNPIGAIVMTALGIVVS